METLKALRCWWALKDKVLVGPYPGVDGVPVMAGLGIRHVINLLSRGDLKKGEGARYRQAWERVGVHPLDLPTPEGKALSQDNARLGLETLLRHKRDGKGILYIHCMGGCGRSGALVAAFLLATREAKPDDLWKRMETLRGDLGGPCPESEVQRRFALKYVGVN